MSWHLCFVWSMFTIGCVLSTLRRADMKVRGPDHTVPNLRAYFETYWIPILYRFAVCVAAYWLLFYPEILTTVLNLVGWNIKLPPIMPQYALVGLIAGIASLEGLDFVAKRFSFLKGLDV